MRISDWSSDVCSSDLALRRQRPEGPAIGEVEMFKDILLPLDLSNAASQERTVSAAIELAKSFGSRLHVMTIVPTFGEGFVSSFFPADYQDNDMAAAKEPLHAFVREKIPTGIPVQHVVTRRTIQEDNLTFQPEQLRSGKECVN